MSEPVEPAALESPSFGSPSFESPSLDPAALFRQIFRVMAQRWRMLLAVVSTVYSPVIAIYLVLIVALVRDADSVDLDQALRATDNGCIQAFANAALVLVVFRFLEGQEASFGRSLRVIFQRFFSLIAVAILTNVALVVGFLLLIVPGVILACALFVITPALVVEDVGPLRAWRRSFDLTEGHRWKIFRLLLRLSGLLLLLVVVAMVPYVVVPETSPYFPVMELVVSLVVSFVIVTLLSVSATVTYFRLREVKEGLGTEELLEVFE